MSPSPREGRAGGGSGRGEAETHRAMEPPLPRRLLPQRRRGRTDNNMYGFRASDFFCHSTFGFPRRTAQITCVVLRGAITIARDNFPVAGPLIRPVCTCILRDVYGTRRGKGRG